MVGWFGWFMVLNATFNNISAISWRSALLVEETGVAGENTRPAASKYLRTNCFQYLKYKLSHVLH
jgi:hypothetical protein